MIGLHKILVATALVAGGRTAPALANKVENIDRMSMGMPNATFPKTTPSRGESGPKLANNPRFHAPRRHLDRQTDRHTDRPRYMCNNRPQEAMHCDAA